MLRKKWLWAVVVLLVVAGVAATVISRRQDQGIRVSAETIQRRDLEAIVSASGKIEPQKTVNISAQSMGRVTKLAVNEGDRVKAGQFLLQIDAVVGRRPRCGATRRRWPAPRTGARAVAGRPAERARQPRTGAPDAEAPAGTVGSRADHARVAREGPGRSRGARKRPHAREQEIKNRETQLRQQEAGLQSSQHSLSQVRFEAPFDGIVTRRNIEEGENVVVGTMNNAGTVLLTVADMSIIEAEIEVDETDIPFVQIGQSAKITIDAIPDKTFTGKVTEIGNSPIQTAATGTTARTATNFKVMVTIDEQVPDVRPGFTCTAEITTATRANVAAVPIQALTVRELLYDQQGTVIPRAAAAQAALPVRHGAGAATTAAQPELQPGQKREEVEGVFVIRDNKATSCR